MKYENNIKKLREPYVRCKAEKYTELTKFFSKDMTFSKNDDCQTIKQKFISEKMYDNNRVWLLFASNDNNSWDCLQVAQSKKGIQREIEDVIDFLFYEFNPNQDNIKFTNSAFYENVCPKVANKDYRELLYSKIGNEYTYFRVCFLDVDKYLEIKPNNIPNGTDIEKIIQICKNQYAEAKIAYQTLAIYWRKYSSGIDGQTISYIVDHTSEFEV